MARYDHLPIYRSAMRLAVHLENTVRGFPRYVSISDQTFEVFKTSKVFISRRTHHAKNNRHHLLLSVPVPCGV